MPDLPEFKSWPADAVDMPAERIAEMYTAGFQGAFREPEAAAELAASQPWHNFEDAAYQFRLVGSGQGGLHLPFHSVLKFSDERYRVAQRRGDCVSFGTRNAVDLARAVEIDIQGEPEGWVEDTATEPIYWYRGHNGEGASCARLAQWVSTAGGLLLRLHYEELGLDLRQYDPKLGQAGAAGPPAAVVEEAKKHPVRSAVPIRTGDRADMLAQARDALANGYGINVCSSFGFRMERNEEGIAEASGSWAHAMAWTGCDDRPETVRKHGGPLFLVQNSWGYRWISGPRVHGQPEGSFWIRPKVAAAMLAQDGAIVFSNVLGFPPRKLPDYGFNWL